jgi:hypothetical protein
MSSGDLTIEGNRARYELRMPLYEVAHVAAPERALLEHIRFSSAGRQATLVSQSCQAEAARDLYVCTADYEFAEPPERVDVECRFTAVTVPNHVHLLQARKGENRDQGIFDRSFTSSTLRFRPPTATEIALRELGAGFMRAFGGPVQVLFLAALVLAARHRRERWKSCCCRKPGRGGL